MTSRYSISTKKVGLPPGHAVFTGVRRVETVRLAWTRYGRKSIEEGEAKTAAELPVPDDADGVLWVSVEGLHDIDLVKAVGERFALHFLAVEDVVSVGGRPLAEVYDGQVFTSAKMLTTGADGALQSEHVSLVFGGGWLISFQETHADLFGPVRQRLRDGRSRGRSRGSDYLWYALLDTIVDHYGVALGALGMRVEELEEEVWSDASSRDLPRRAQDMRHQLLLARRAVRPLREQLAQLTGDYPAPITEATQPFLADLETHLLQHQDVIDHLRDAVTSLLEAHVSVVTMRTNEIMRVLTILASIFIPLTFITGVYGMNFEHMPELAIPWAYPATWGVMVATAAALLVYFWRKGWL
ncbi:MAG TPA: magnesium/cobalt transporter CorA [Longimicrobiales bacterium]|nr:magnesium/cobalt transporter CorA [Longimicrobiales bacterium]